jgi:hypothetical protein
MFHRFLPPLSLPHRERLPEVMDDPGLDAQRHVQALQQLS